MIIVQQVCFNEDIGVIYKVRLGFDDIDDNEENWLLDRVRQAKCFKEFYWLNHHQFNTHECSMNNKIHEKAHTLIQKKYKKDTKRRITQPKLIQKNKTKNCPECVPH